MLLLLQVGVVLLERVVVRTQLVEARRLDQHPGIRASQAGHGEGADHGRRDEYVRVVQRQRYLTHSSVLVPAYQQNVMPALQTKALCTQIANPLRLDSCR